MLKIRLILLLSLCVIYGCEPTLTSFNKVDEFIKSNYNNVQISNYDYLVILNEQGDCVNCNNSFSIAMNRYVNEENVLFIVSTHGAHIDISHYLENQDKKNVLLDFRNGFSELKLIDSPSILVLGDNKIDSIIEINLYTMAKSVQSFSPSNKFLTNFNK